MGPLGHQDAGVRVTGAVGVDGLLRKAGYVLGRPLEADMAATGTVPHHRDTPVRQELRDRLDDPSLTIVDVRTPEEYAGKAGSPCDPRQAHIPGARLLEYERLYEGPGRPRSPEEVRQVAGLAEGAQVVAYCHSGSRSALAALALRAAGYDARNYPGSWHEWSRHEELPVEK